MIVPTSAIGLPRGPSVPNGRVPIQPEFEDGLPPLPEIRSEALRLQVFTHRSFYARPTHVFEDMPDDPSPDNESLEHLGDSVLSLVVTGLLRTVYPCLRVGPSTKIRALVVGNPTLAWISVQYRLPERLRMHPAQAITLQASPNIQADLFESFVGGLYIDQGLEAVQAWLHPLIRPFLVIAYRSVRVQHGLPPEPPYSMHPPSYFEAAGTHRSTRITAYPSQTWSTPPPPRMPASIGHLSLFNQHMQQQCKSIEWVYSDSAGEGTRTTPIWVVRAMVDGECLGRGRGSTKKAARNEAAKEGLAKLGVPVPWELESAGSSTASSASSRSELQHLVFRLALDGRGSRRRSSRTGVQAACEGLLGRMFIPRMKGGMLPQSARWSRVLSLCSRALKFR